MTWTARHLADCRSLIRWARWMGQTAIAADLERLAAYLRGRLERLPC